MSTHIFNIILKVACVALAAQIGHKGRSLEMNVGKIDALEPGVSLWKATRQLSAQSISLGSTNHDLLDSIGLDARLRRASSERSGEEATSPAVQDDRVGPRTRSRPPTRTEPVLGVADEGRDEILRFPRNARFGGEAERLLPCHNLW